MGCPRPPRFDAVARNPEAGTRSRRCRLRPPVLRARRPCRAPGCRDARATTVRDGGSPLRAPSRARRRRIRRARVGRPFSDFSLEVLKDGAIVDVVDCRGAVASPSAAPPTTTWSSSTRPRRLHAVLQFSEGGDEIFLYDAGSTHGTFVNRRKLKSRVHAPVFVGDQIRFGQSSRTFIVAGAQELMPEEDSPRRATKTPRAGEDVRGRSDACVAGGGARKGGGGGGGGGGWRLRRLGRRRRRRARRRRARARDARLARTPRRLHRKTTRKDRKDSKEKAKVEALKTEMECIRAKESESAPLSQGQRTTSRETRARWRNSRRRSRTWTRRSTNPSACPWVPNQAPVRTVEEPRADEGRTRGRTKRGSDSDSDDEDDEDDDFYDRTESAAARRRKREKARAERAAGGEGKSKNGGVGGASRDGAPATVETAATLWEKREVIDAAIRALESRLCDAQEAASAAADARGDRGEDELDAFMDQIGATTDAEEVRRLGAQIAEKRSESERLARLLRWRILGASTGPVQISRTVAKLADAERAKVVAAVEKARRRAEAKAAAEKEEEAAAAERARLRAWEARGTSPRRDSSRADQREKEAGRSMSTTPRRHARGSKVGWRTIKPPRQRTPPSRSASPPRSKGEVAGAAQRPGGGSGSGSGGCSGGCSGSGSWV